MPITFRIRTHRGALRVAARVDRTVGLSRAIARDVRADSSVPSSVKRAVIDASWKVERASALSFLAALRAFYLKEHSK